MRTIATSQQLIVCSDAHHPYSDADCWRLFLKVAAERKPAACIIIGDFPDNYAVSDHRKDPRREGNFKKEIDAAIVAKKQLDAIGFKRKVWTEGNHEDRLPRFL